MEYRTLGPTGLKVSALSFGNMTMDDLTKQKDYNDIIQRCREQGVNFFDSAEFYHFGKSETILGEALKALKIPREEVILSTKVYFSSRYSIQTLHQPKIPNTFGLSRKHIIEGVTASLGRLQTDHADIVFCSRFDCETPMEETCRAMNWLVESGKIFYWGTSEWNAQQIQEAITVCDRLDLVRPVAEQSQYNMFVRDRFEVDYAPLFDKYRMGTTVWSPLAGGILTGKYNDDIPADSRCGKDAGSKHFFFDPHMAGDKKEKSVSKLKDLGLVAQELGATLPQLAIAWVIANNDVSTALLGATSIAQLDDNFKALELSKKLSPAVLEKVEAILANRPKAGMNWKTFAPAAPRR